MASKIDLISSALVLIGDKPINSLTTAGRAQETANALYDDIVKNEISKHRWGFARTEAQLALTTSTPINDTYQSIYQLPTDLLVLIRINPAVPYQILGDKVHTNLTSKLTIEYIADVPESEWPVYFAQMIKYALATDFASAIRDSNASFNQLSAEYVNASRMARYTDSIQHPQTPIVHRPFIEVRF